jgi:predicted nuclease of predicted toxin-antitoxin system
MTIRDFDFLTDEHVSRDVVNYLRSLGFDVLDVCESSWQGRPDHELLAEAYASDRVVLTCDGDYVTLIVHYSHDAVGVVRLRPGNVPATLQIDMIDELLRTDPDVRPPFIAVVTQSPTMGAISVRVRNL